MICAVLFLVRCSFVLICCIVDSFTYMVYICSAVLTLIAIFGAIEDQKKILELDGYSVSQTSLEQIFNQFAAQQEEETGAVAGMA